MTLRDTVELTAPPAVVASVLRDPERLVKALPNVDEWAWESQEDGTFLARIRPAIALGEVPLRTHWKPVAVTDGRVHYSVQGRTDESRIRLDAELRLLPSDPGTTVEWTVDWHVTGSLRAVTQRTIEPVIEAQVRLVIDAVGRVAEAD